MNKKIGIVTIALIFFILISSITVVFASLIKEEISSTKTLSTIENKKIKQTGKEVVAEIMNDKEVTTKISNLQAITISNETIKKLANVNNNQDMNNKVKTLKNELNDDVYSVSLKQDNLNSIKYWDIKCEQYYSRVNAETGELILIHYKVPEFADTKKTKEEITNIANELYEQLNYQNEYQLYSLEKFDDATWIANFANKENGIFNPYQKVKLVILPEINFIESISILNLECDNNEIIINEEDAINTVIKELKNRRNINIDEKTITSNIEIRRTNYFWEVDDFYNYKNSDVIRVVWEISGNSDKGNITAYVDATNGDIVGGDIAYAF